MAINPVINLDILYYAYFPSTGYLLFHLEKVNIYLASLIEVEGEILNRL